MRRTRLQGDAVNIDGFLWKPQEGALHGDVEEQLDASTRSVQGHIDKRDGHGPHSTQLPFSGLLSVDASHTSVHKYIPATSSAVCPRMYPAEPRRIPDEIINVERICVDPHRLPCTSGDSGTNHLSPSLPDPDFSPLKTRSPSVSVQFW